MVQQFMVTRLNRINPYQLVETGSTEPGKTEFTRYKKDDH